MKRKAASTIFNENYAAPQSQAPESPAPAKMTSPPLSGAAFGYTEERFGEMPTPKPAADSSVMRNQMMQNNLVSSEELQLEKEPIHVRETGFWRWKRVIVPPNVYVVQTRLGRKDPVTIGQGISFSYNPFTDAYLIVPAAMQTIGVVANSITKEKQGINILAYLQWQIDNFALAYRKLDFSDSRDPLGIVNAQLREQAEAAIKDKIATMSVEEVLTDKAPIIEELTTRLKAVAEGRQQSGQASDGLGIKIVTVQIREALVSSQRLWQDLQAPFRYQQEKLARLSYLAMQDEIRQKELQTRQATETREAETMVEIARIKQSTETEATELRLTQEALRFTKEQETTRQTLQLEEQTLTTRRESERRLEALAAQIAQARHLSELQHEQARQLEQTRLAQETAQNQKAAETAQALHALTEEGRLGEARLKFEQEALTHETALKQQQAALDLQLQTLKDEREAKIQEAQLARERAAHLAELEKERERSLARIAELERELELARRQQEVYNQIKEPDLVRRLIDKLPELMANRPDIHEMRILQTGGGDPTFDALLSMGTKLAAVAESFGFSLKNKDAAPSA